MPPAAPPLTSTGGASPGRATGRSTIRARLGFALAVGLTPILLLGAAQAFAGFRHDAVEHQRTLLQSAQRSAIWAKGRIQAAVTLMETLTPETTGFECSARLAEAKSRLPGYRNLVRLNSSGRVTCSADSVVFTDRHETEWFKRVEAGEAMVIARGQTVAAKGPAVLSVVRVNDAKGQFDGAIIAAMPLETLKPDLDDPTLAAGTQVAIADANGGLVLSTDPKAFGSPPPHWTDRVPGGGGLYSGVDSTGVRRDFAAAPLMDRSVFVVLSAPATSLMSWARINPVVSILLPLLAWLVAWAAIWFAVDGQVIRWLLYLDRIASIYAKGRFTVRPVAAEKAPAEIRALAQTLDSMATALVARDETLRENMAQKDALMREIHHRVKNNLQVITSLLNMQQRALKDPAARAAMYDTRQRITALALIYRALYQSPDLRRVDVRQFLEELIAQMVTGEGGGGSRVRSEFEADDLEIDPDKLAPLALFAVEALTNARKHAYPAGEGVVRIRFKVAADEAMLEISDDGQGDASLGGETGVGRTLMTAFARQLRGRVEFISEPGAGLCVRLTFPTPEPEPAVDISSGAVTKSGNQAAA
ncbi:sensor histidine kinase PhyK [soil metagenome]